MAELSNKVVSAMEHLGATRRERPKARRMSLMTAATLPEPLREFIEDFDWPVGVTYGSTDEYGEPECFGIDFAYDPLQELGKDHIGPAIEGLRLFMIGIMGGEYVVAVSMDDPDLTDPIVWVVDHFIPEDESLEGYSFRYRMSELLEALCYLQ